MIAQTLIFLIQTLTGLFVLVLLLRFYLQVARAPFKHPLAQFCMALTNFAVLPARRLIPSVHGYDAATLVLAWLVSFLANVLIKALYQMYELLAVQSMVAIALISVVDVFHWSLILLGGAVLVQAVLSWINPYNPLAPVLEALTRPFLAPFRRAVVGGVDLSPLILLLLIQVILMLPVQALYGILGAQIRMAM
jgi:YggT family protein